MKQQGSVCLRKRSGVGVELESRTIFSASLIAKRSWTKIAALREPSSGMIGRRLGSRMQDKWKHRTLTMTLKIHAAWVSSLDPCGVWIALPCQLGLVKCQVDYKKLRGPHAQQRLLISQMRKVAYALHLMAQSQVSQLLNPCNRYCELRKTRLN